MRATASKPGFVLVAVLAILFVCGMFGATAVVHCLRLERRCERECVRNAERMTALSGLELARYELWKSYRDFCLAGNAGSTANRERWEKSCQESLFSEWCSDSGDSSFSGALARLNAIGSSIAISTGGAHPVWSAASGPQTRCNVRFTPRVTIGNKITLVAEASADGYDDAQSGAALAFGTDPRSLPRVTLAEQFCFGSEGKLAFSDQTEPVNTDPISRAFEYALCTREQQFFGLVPGAAKWIVNGDVRATGSVKFGNDSAGFGLTVLNGTVTVDPFPDKSPNSPRQWVHEIGESATGSDAHRFRQPEYAKCADLSSYYDGQGEYADSYRRRPSPTVKGLTAENDECYNRFWAGGWECLRQFAAGSVFLTPRADERFALPWLGKCEYVWNWAHDQRKSTTTWYDENGSRQSWAHTYYGQHTDALTKNVVFMFGTYDKPIELDGMFYVQGDVIVGGWVSGRGAIASARNVYIVKNVLLKDPPNWDHAAADPAEDAKANIGKNILSIQARGMIVIGDYGDANFRDRVLRAASPNGTAARSILVNPAAGADTGGDYLRERRITLERICPSEDPYSNLANVTAAYGDAVDAEPITQIEATLYANLGVIGVVGSADWDSGLHHERKTVGGFRDGADLPNGCVYRHFGSIVADVIALYARGTKSSGAASEVEPYAIFDWDARLAPWGDAMPDGVWPNPAILPPDMGVTQPPAVLHWTEIDSPEQLNVLSNPELTGRWL